MDVSAPVVDVGTRVARAEESLILQPGQVAGLNGLPGTGMTRLGLAMLAPHAERGPVAILDVRGWINPTAAWEVGIDPDRVVVVRTDHLVRWGRIAATLLDGVAGVYAEVPPGVKGHILRKLSARARARRTPMVLRPVVGSVPSGVAQVTVGASSVEWSGVDSGHGLLLRRRTLLTARGHLTRGIEQTIEVEDDGTHDLRVVPHLGAHQTRQLA